jgi:hypothetical protein
MLSAEDPTTDLEEQQHVPAVQFDGPKTLEGVDFSQLTAMPIAHSTMLVSHFINNSLKALSLFAHSAQDKLARLTRQVDLLEISVSLLETKLNSIEWLAAAVPQTPDVIPIDSSPSVPIPTPPHPPPSVMINAPSAPPVPEPAPIESNNPRVSNESSQNVPDNLEESKRDSAPESVNLEINPNEPVIKDDPRLQKYFKMLKLGILKQQIKMDMKVNGLDPEIIDKDPNTPVSQIQSLSSDDPSASSEPENASAKSKKAKSLHEAVLRRKNSLPRNDESQENK